MNVRSANASVSLARRSVSTLNRLATTIATIATATAAIATHAEAFMAKTYRRVAGPDGTIKRDATQRLALGSRRSTHSERNIANCALCLSVKISAGFIDQPPEPL